MARPLSVYEFQSNKAYVLGFVTLVTSIAFRFKFTNTYTGDVFNQCLAPSQISNIVKFLLHLSKAFLVKYRATSGVLITELGIFRTANHDEKSFLAIQ